MKATLATKARDVPGSTPAEEIRGDRDRERQERALRFVDGIGLPAGARVLHLGCGQLALAGKLLERGFSLLGLAPAARDVEDARRAHAPDFPKAEFRAGDPEALDLEDESFDLIVADDQIGGLAHERWALQEMRRVLKPGGHLVLTVANRLTPSVLLRSLLSSGSSVEYARSGNGVAGRGYWAPLLLRGLAELGYETLRREGSGFTRFAGVPRRPAGNAIRKSFDWLGTSSVILCRRRVVSEKVEERWIFTAAADRIGRFELTRHADIRRRARLYSERSDLSEARPVVLECLVGVPDRVLVIAALPGDELVGCGGTLLSLRERGVELAILGPVGGIAGEAEAVANALGAACYPLLNLDDPGELAALLGKLRPELIFVPVPSDARPERRQAARMLRTVLTRWEEFPASTWIAGYEAESLAPANAFTEIDAHMSRKLRLLLEYRGAMRRKDLAGHCRVANSYHAHRLQGRKGFNECFHALSARDYLKFYSGSS